jgi:hypothetical protein
MLVLSFHSAILLRRLNTRYLMNNAFGIKKLFEIKFWAIITSYFLDFQPYKQNFAQEKKLQILF